jgi:hypothetical protein
MFWKIAATGLLLWFVHSNFHVNGGIMALVAIVAATALLVAAVLPPRNRRGRSRRPKQARESWADESTLRALQRTGFE